jgi:hypothetical protein
MIIKRQDPQVCYSISHIHTIYNVLTIHGYDPSFPGPGTELGGSGLGIGFWLGGFLLTA